MKLKLYLHECDATSVESQTPASPELAGAGTDAALNNFLNSPSRFFLVFSN